MNPQNDPPSAPSKPTKHQKHGKNPFYAGPPGQTTNKSDSAQPTLSIPPTTTAPTASNRATKRARDELEPKPSTDDDESEPDTEHSVSELNGLSKPDLVALVLRLQRHTRRLEGEIRTALAKVPLGEDELRQKVEELRTEIRTGIAEQMNFPVAFDDAVWRVEGTVERARVWVAAFGPPRLGFEPLKTMVMGLVVQRAEGMLKVIERGYGVVWNEGERRYAIRGNFAPVLPAAE